jgi:hypothetical protein
MKLLLLIVAACAVIVPIQGNNKLCFDQSVSKPRRGKQTVRVIPKTFQPLGINFKQVLRNNLEDVSGGDCGDNKKIGKRVWLINHTHSSCMRLKNNYFEVTYEEMLKPFIENPSNIISTKVDFLHGTCAQNAIYPTGHFKLEVIPH